MEKRKPFFLTRLFTRIPQNSEFSEAKGWEDTTDDTRFNGWDSSPGSSISGATNNGWGYEKPKTEYNGWGSGSGSASKGRSSAGRSGEWVDDNGWNVAESEATDNGWVCEKPKDEYNGWVCEKPSDEYNGWVCEKPKDEYNGWESGSGSRSKGRNSADRSGGWMDSDAPESKPISQQAEIDVNSLPIAKPTPLKVESWPPPPLPSAPPIPDGGFSENPAANEGGNRGALCVVCWEAPVEGACVPCGHMASCMTCLHEIESRNGSCPICRSKIDKVIKIYTISTK